MPGARFQITRATCSACATVSAGVDRMLVLKGHQREQQPQGLRKANQGKTDSYCLDRQYVIPQAKSSDPFRDQNVKTPEPKSDHRDAAESDHIGEDSSVHGQLLPLPPVPDPNEPLGYRFVLIDASSVIE